jgi:hypothetical protein
LGLAGCANSGGGDPEAAFLPITGESYDESRYAEFIQLEHHYQFPLDDQGWAMIEPGSNHKKIYVSSSSGSDANNGLTPETPLLTIEAAISKLAAPSSDWILLKRGDSFGNFGRIRDINGESPGHPTLIGAYGEGNRPIINGHLRLWAEHENIVIRDLHFRFVGKYCLDVLSSVRNLYIENVITEGCESRIQGDESARHWGVTLRRVQILDAHFEEPNGGASDWLNAHGNRISGIYIASTTGLLIEESFADMNGWKEGFDSNGGAGPQPPSMYSHSFYIQGSTKEVIFRGNIVARAASFGAQVRPGGVVQRNIFIGNNAAFYTGGEHASLVEDNIVTLAGNKKAPQIGALGWGIGLQNVAGTELLYNMIVHSIDPLDPMPPDFASGAISSTEGAIMEGNIVYNWGSSTHLPSDSSSLSALENRSLVAYSQASLVGSNDLESFLNEYRLRDRDNWPNHLGATPIYEYFFSGLGL